MEIILWGTDVACNGMNARILGMKNSTHPDNWELIAIFV
jgi:hypothetical protein